jgi:hypothetical protein
MKLKTVSILLVMGVVNLTQPGMAGSIQGKGLVKGEGMVAGKAVVKGEGSATGTGLVLYRNPQGQITVKRGTGTVTGQGIALGWGSGSGELGWELDRRRDRGCLRLGELLILAQNKQGQINRLSLLFLLGLYS